jgi:RimJ/RimL family protein N-acetyltransferase
MTNEVNTEKATINKSIEIISADGEITLRQYASDNAKEIFELIDRNRAHLSQFGEGTADKYPTLERMWESIAHPKNPEKLRFEIRNKRDQLVGTINLTPDKNNPTAGETGCYLGEEFQGHGYAGKSLNLLTDYAFDVLGFKTIYAIVDEENIRSLNVLFKAGYRETGRNDEKIHYEKQKYFC